MTMTVVLAGADTAPRIDSPSRLDAYVAAHEFERPTLVIDVDRVETQYRALKAGLGCADIHYAVKANPARDVIARLVKLGSHFDAASRGEIEICLGEGATPDQISFGNTIKRRQDIEWARDNGITLFAADAEEELEKIAEIAPGSDVYIRLIVEASEADWPLTRKFGCDGETAIRLMDYAKSLGLSPVGMSFHVGSQTRWPRSGTPPRPQATT
jgi:ornithine decarboxylase